MNPWYNLSENIEFSMPVAYLVKIEWFYINGTPIGWLRDVV